MQTDTCRELQKRRDEREQIRQTADTAAAADSDTCIAHNYKNTEMNESRSDTQTDKQQQIQANSSQRFRQQIQIQANRADACRRNHPKNIQATGTIR
ncbi:hypothetical protein Tco_0631442 [Tanacetum coccineum]